MQPTVGHISRLPTASFSMAARFLLREHKSTWTFNRSQPKTKFVLLSLVEWRHQKVALLSQTHCQVIGALKLIRTIAATRKLKGIEICRREKVFIINDRCR